MKLRDRRPKLSEEVGRRSHSGSRLLVVSEDPLFIERVRAAVAVGVEVVACLGPTGNHCVLEDRAACPLVELSSVALVVEPPGGAFHHHLKHISARDYADLLQRLHPSTTVLLTSAETAPEVGDGVPSMARATALSLLTWLPPALLTFDPEEAIMRTGGEG